MDVRSSPKAPQARQKFWIELTRRLSAIPGVRNIALAGDAVFGNGDWSNTVWIAHPGQSAQYVHIAENYVSPGFFATAGIPIITGREFGEQDRENTPSVVVVNLTFARRFFAGENPIGRRLGNGPDASTFTNEIVGVVADAKYGSVREKPQPMFFRSLWQETAFRSCVVHIRTVSEPILLESSIRREIEAIDNEAVISEIRSVPQIIRNQLREDRMFATLATFFALLALALGAIGIYGIVAYRAAQRTAEIGVRMALGAQRRDVLWLIMRETIVLLVIGTAVGVPAALAAARLIRSQLFALDSSDPLTFTCAIVAVFAAGVLAAFLPAWRATSVAPMLALQSD
jgi:predicted permease